MQKQFDWLALSKLPPNNAENIILLSQIFKGASVSPQMFNRLPKSYLSKLFLTVRTQLVGLKNNIPFLEEAVSMKLRQKQEMIQKVKAKQAKLFKSKQQLEEQQNNIQILQETYHKLQSKLTKIKNKSKNEKKVEKTQITTKETLYCPYCRIDGFQNRDHFENHMLTQHPLKGQDSNRSDNLKEVVMALKQKQMALMEMVLQKNDHVQEMNRRLVEQELMFKTRQFQNQYGKSGLTSVESQPIEQLQLASQTQYVWFQKQNDSKKSNEIDNYQTNRSQYQKSCLLNSKQQHRHVKIIQPNYSPAPYTVQFISTMQQLKPIRQQLDLGTRLGLYTTQKQPLKKYTSINENFENSMYQTKNMSKISGGYIYFSGQLQDQDSDSQASDYFRIKKPVLKIIDEQIEVPAHLLNKQHQNKSLTINTLLSPKGQNKISNNSALHSALFSMQDKDFSLSKDSGSINLSDLKYQDLLIKKQIQRKNQSPIKDFIKQPIGSFTKKVSQNLLLSEFYEDGKSFQLPMKKISTYRASNTLLLDQFLISNKNVSNISRVHKSPKTQKSRQKVSVLQIPAGIRKMQKTQNKKNSSHCQIVSQHPVFQNFIIPMEQSNVQFEPTNRSTNSEPQTQRLILETLIDLTLIRQQQLQQSINELKNQH